MTRIEEIRICDAHQYVGRLNERHIPFKWVVVALSNSDTPHWRNYVRILVTQGTENRLFHSTIREQIEMFDMAIHFFWSMHATGGATIYKNRFGDRYSNGVENFVFGEFLNTEIYGLIREDKWEIWNEIIIAKRQLLSEMRGEIMGIKQDPFKLEINIPKFEF